MMSATSAGAQPPMVPIVHNPPATPAPMPARVSTVPPALAYFFVQLLKDLPESVGQGSGGGVSGGKVAFQKSGSGEYVDGGPASSGTCNSAITWGVAALGETPNPAAPTMSPGGVGLPCCRTCICPFPKISMS